MVSTAHDPDTASFDPHETAFMRALCIAALEAGARIMEHYKNGVEAEEKSINRRSRKLTGTPKTLLSAHWPRLLRISR